MASKIENAKEIFSGEGRLAGDTAVRVWDRLSDKPLASRRTVSFRTDRPDSWSTSVPADLAVEFAKALLDEPDVISVSLD